MSGPASGESEQRIESTAVPVNARPKPQAVEQGQLDTVIGGEQSVLQVHHDGHNYHHGNISAGQSDLEAQCDQVTRRFG
jgi:hypothetical protein